MATALVVGLAAGPAEGTGRQGSRTVKRTTATTKKKAAPGTTTRRKPAGTVGGSRKAAARRPAPAQTKPTAAATRPSPPAEVRLTRDQRFAAARAGAVKAMKPFAGGGLDIEAVLAREQIQLTPGSKFLGRGPVRVIIRPKVTGRTTRWQRWTQAFRSDHNRRVLMSVSETGVPGVMDDEPDAIQHRVWRRINAIIPFAEITRDVVSSDKAKAGLVGALGSLFTFAIRPEVAVGVGLVALSYVSKGVKERRAARKSALDRTAAFVREKESASETPAVSVAYRFYQGEMEEAGSRPISMDAFVEQMSYRLGKPDRGAVATTTAPAAPAAPSPATTN